MNIETNAHPKALAEKEKKKKKERARRRSRVGLTIARTNLQTVREGGSYLKFEAWLQSLQQAGLDIGSLNHSRKSIKTFVESMTKLWAARSKGICMKLMQLQVGSVNLHSWRKK